MGGAGPGPRAAPHRMNGFPMRPRPATAGGEETRR